jgi:outer membrane protein assembly factor BamB
MVAPPADAIMSARPSVPPAVSRVSFLTTVMAWLPFLMAVQAATLFARSNYLLPEAGMVRAVLCFDAKSGELLWKTPVYVDVAEKKHSFNSHATPTPACDEDGVYAYFGSGLAALDRSGRVRWLLRDPDFHRHSRYGTGSSVVLAGEWLIVYNDSEFQGHGGHHLDDNVEGQQGRRQSHLTAVNKKTGERRWSVSPAYSHDSYMTPLVWERDGELEVVIATWKTLAGFALKDGSQRWTHGYPMQQIVPSLAVNDDCLFVTGGNFQPYPVHAIRPATFDTVWTVSKGGGNIVSPVCWEGQLYTVNHAGFLFCRDADSGRFRWQTRLGGRCRRRCPPATARSSSSIRREHCTSWTRNRATCWLSLPWKRTARRRPPWRTAASLSGPTNTSAAWRANEYSKVPIFALSP